MGGVGLEGSADVGVDVGRDAFAGVVEAVLNDFHGDAGFESAVHELQTALYQEAA